MFTELEHQRYARHLILPELGMEGQIRLKKARVLVIGAGGLGCPLLTYLAAAGIGTIGIVDDDHIEASNLHRQPLYTEQDLGKYKAQVAAERIRQINPHVKTKVHRTRLDPDNVFDLLEGYDFVVDGSDNFPTRYLCNDACVLEGKPLVHGAINRFEGQVSVFNWTDAEGNTSANYRDIFPEMPDAGSVPDCSEAGVLGVLPGIVGSIMAAEAIKIAAQIGQPLAGKLWMFDALTMQSQIIRFRKNPNNQITELGDYGNGEAFCAIKPSVAKEITVAELKAKLLKNKDLQIIDVRTAAEFASGHLPNSLLMPVDNIRAFAPQIERANMVVVVCHSGIRSAHAIRVLEKDFGFENLWNLKGGIVRWGGITREW